jgi:hypothetical protein
VLDGWHGVGVDLPQIDRHERVLLDQGDVPLPRQFQAGEQSPRPGPAPAQLIAPAYVIPAIDRGRNRSSGAPSGREASMATMRWRAVSVF